MSRVRIAFVCRSLPLGCRRLLSSVVKLLLSVVQLPLSVFVWRKNGHARRGTGGTLNRQSAIAGLNSLLEVVGFGV